MNFEELWEHQQGAIFLQKDHIYEFRKNLATFFFRKGSKYSKDKIEARLALAIEQRNKYHAVAEMEGMTDFTIDELDMQLENLRGENEKHK